MKRVISVEHLTKYYQVHQKEAGLSGSFKSLFNRKYYDAKAVDDISFRINEGELIGFIGPNGAGKTTTLKCLTGLLYPTSGSVNVLGYEPFARKNEYLRQISLVMGQKNQLWWDLPAKDSFLLNKEIYKVSDAKYKKTVDELSEILDVTDILQVQVRKLSLGQRMKCELIASLIHTPQILFLDEPTIGLDVMMQQKLREFIKSYNEQYNATILLTSHYMKDVEQLCERVIIIDHGKILYDGSLSDIVKKYATHKSISVDFETPVHKKDLEQFGKIVSFQGNKAVITMPRAQSNHVAAQLLQSFPVQDLNIEEANIEEIIRDVFSNKASSM
jgi:ABC-2 type transport system ATP-binding protein